MKQYVYIASPYTKGDPAENVGIAVTAADQLAAAGIIPFCPLLFHFWHFKYPHSYEFWISQSLAWLDKCDAVLRLEGESDGADKEVSKACDLGKPIFWSISEVIYFLGPRK